LASITMSFSLSQVGIVRGLAKKIDSITGRGRHYPVRNWKWICPRTANSLNRFADYVMAFRRSH
jgi:hypothetical protein